MAILPSDSKRAGARVSWCGLHLNPLNPLTHLPTHSSSAEFAARYTPTRVIAMDAKKEVEKGPGESHRIRVTLNSMNVENIEKGE
jgi:hypothetical protein